MIDKILNYQRVEYYCKLSAQDFKTRLSRVLNLKGYNLSGKFTSDRDFKLSDAWTIGIFIQSFENDPAYLKGRIKDSKEGIIVDVLVRPNSIFSIFGLLFPLIGIYTLISSDFGKAAEGAIFFIIFGLIWYLIGIYLKVRIRNKFEDYLGLERPNRKQRATTR
ncbi:hypothetical protein [Carboxylicivirga marina]|uniref:Uncharacterized protein n=1 Tax=Carboxylicivirga marina TaxID=2800988 RepID=A0ABS1HQN3_9BACT|nr:hypothetical protein [Carboxylicivirga marina]MBK3519981.1 hypothetical protein [Carboxylicivirga marina]